MRPVLFSSTNAAPCTVGRTRNSARPPTKCNRSTASILGFADGLALDDVDIDHIIEAEIALNARARRFGRHPAPVSDTAGDIAARAFAAAFVENNGRLPRHVGKRKLARLQRLPPRRQRARCFRTAAGAELLD